MKTLLLPTLFVLLTFTAVSAAAADGLEPPVPVRTVAPKFPADMLREGVSGLVTVNILIDEKGHVQEPHVEKASHDAFVAPALDALKRWRFKPAKRAGEVIALRVSIPIVFNNSET